MNEFGDYYNLLNKNKIALIDDITQVDDLVLQLIKNYEETSLQHLRKKRLEIFMEIIEITKTYVKMKDTLENVIEKLCEKLDEYELACEPQRDQNTSFSRQSSSTNPFYQSGHMLQDSDSETITNLNEPEHLEEHPAKKEKNLVAIEQVQNVVANGFTKHESVKLLDNNNIQLKKHTAEKEENVISIAIVPDHVKEFMKRESINLVHNDNKQIERCTNVGESDLITLRRMKNAADKFFKHESVKLAKNKNIQTEKHTAEKEENVISIEGIPNPIANDVMKHELVSSPDHQTKDDKKTQTNSSSCTAETKLMKSGVHDRIEEAQKKIPMMSLPRHFKLSPFPSKSTDNTTPNPETMEQSRSHLEIKNDVLKCGQECTFSYIKDPSEFYVRTNEQLYNGVVELMQEDFEEHSFQVHRFKTKAEAKDALGNFCVAYFGRKNSWRRVKVIDWIDDVVDKVMVQLVDSGERRSVEFYNLCKLTEFYATFPTFAIKCHFAGIRPPNRSRHWPEETTHYLANLVQMEKEKKFKIIFQCKEGNSYAVDLLDHDVEPEMTIGEILVNKKLAVQVIISSDTESYSDDPEEFDNINEVVAGYDAQDESRICPFTNKRGSCYKGTRCKLEHKKLSADGVTTDTVLTYYAAFNSLILPLEGQFIKILVTGYINTCHFYAQIIDEKSNTSVFSVNFEHLRDFMNSGKMISSYEPFKVWPGIGEIVLVKHEDEWHRGVCKEPGDTPDSIRIFFLDYGLLVTKKFKDIRHIKEEFLNLPFQAVECILANCIQKPTATEEEASDFFSKCQILQTLDACVVHSEEPLALQVWDLENVDLSNVLKRLGLGEDRTQDLHPSREGLIQLHS